MCEVTDKIERTPALMAKLVKVGQDIKRLLESLEDEQPPENRKASAHG